MDMEITLINNNAVLASNISFELGNVDVPNIRYMYGFAFSMCLFFFNLTLLHGLSICSQQIGFCNLLIIITYVKYTGIIIWLVDGSVFSPSEAGFYRD